MKILINTTHPDEIGGVSNHYKGLKKYWSEDVFYNYIGHRYNIPGSIIFIFDIIKFIIKCLVLKPDIVVLNPSLRKNALKRDGLFLNISKLIGKKTIVFFHGWDVELERRITSSSNDFIKKFNHSDGFLVLASEFRKALIKWGITKPIYLTTTKVDDELVGNFELENKKYDQTLLYLARVEPEKGIFITLKAFKGLKSKLSQVSLIIAGSGSALNKAKKTVKNEKINNVFFKGHVRGGELKSVFKQSDVYILPTYSEGMPTSVLEAMAFGLPVITRPVGGITDFFKNGKMGFLINSFEYCEYSKAVIELLRDKKKLKAISEYNYNYAKDHFMASKVAKSLEKIFKKVLSQ